MMNRIVGMVVLGLVFATLQAQDLEQFTRPATISHSGSLSAQTQFYQSTGGADRATTHWSLAGRYSLKVGDMHLPFSFSLRQVSGSVNHPFNWVGISPYYKWIKLHLGRRNLYFSPYTLSGKTVNGVGIELTPGRFRFGAIYGTIRNYRVPDFDEDRAAVVDLSKRKAIGGKVGYGSDANYFDVSFFKGIDELDGLEASSFAKDNLALGAKLHLTPLPRLSIEANVGASGITENRSSLAIDLSDDVAPIRDVLDVNASSRLNFAGDASISYRATAGSVGLKYRRVDPLYQSLGAPYFLTDIESLTAQMSLSLLKRRWRISASAGMERNNLSGDRINDRRRLIASLHSSYKVSDQLHLSGSYSNFQIDANPALQSFSDTLRYVSISESATISVRYSFADQGQLTHSLILTATQQTVDDQSPIANLGSDIANRAASLRYQLKLKDLGLRVAPGVRYTSFSNGISTRTRYGLTLRASQQFFDKKLTSSATMSYAYSDLDGKRNGSIIRVYLISRYRTVGLGSLMLRVSLSRRELIVRESFSEVRAALGYTISL